MKACLTLCLALLLSTSLAAQELRFSADATEACLVSHAATDDATYIGLAAATCAKVIPGATLPFRRRNGPTD